MKKNLCIFVVLLFPAIVLGGCGSKISSNTILDRMGASMGAVEQFEFFGQFNLMSTSGDTIFEGLTNLNISFDGQVNLVNLENLCYLINLLVNGSGREGDTRIGAEVRSFSDYNYFRITDISVPLDLPFSLTTNNQWYKVKKSQLSGGNFLGVNPRSITNKEFQQIRDLIRDSRLFLVNHTLAEEMINGVRSYHLSTIIDRFALDEFLDQLDNITQGRLELDKQFWMRLIDGYIYDLWIAKQDYKLTRLKVGGLSTNEEDNKIIFEIELNLTHFETPIDISKPSEIQEFNLNRLFGLPF